MPASTAAAKFEQEHRRALDTMKGERQKELEKLKSDAAAAAEAQQALTQKLDKATARRSILEQEVCCNSMCDLRGLLRGLMPVQHALARLRRPALF